MATANYSSKINQTAIQNVISDILKERIEEVTSREVPTYFAFKTQEVLKTKKALEDLRKQVRNMNILLKGRGEIPLEKYFEAYELLLDVRKFFLGEKGEIDYSILFSRKENQEAYIYNVIIDHKTFRQLLFNEKNTLQGIKFQGESLRFDQSMLPSSLKKIIDTLKSQGINCSVIEGDSFFKLTNEKVGKSKYFKEGKLFKEQIELAKKRVGARYFFDIDITVNKKDGKDVFSYFFNKVEGSPMSSSVFSAIGKYAADQIQAKEAAFSSQLNMQKDVMISSGHLTEIYILAKDKLNQGKNNFPERRRVYATGSNGLFEIFSQVRRNSDSFYSGGDYLTEQIKSFLGSAPSLTTIKTIRNGIQNIDEALNQPDLEEIKKSLLEQIIKKQNNLMKAENQLAKELTQTLLSFQLQS